MIHISVGCTVIHLLHTRRCGHIVKIKLVYGAPASGKTTYVKKSIGDNDIVYDFDDIMQAMTGLPYQQMNPNLIDFVTDMRTSLIKSLKYNKKIDTAYIITTFIGDRLEKELKGLDVEYVKMDVPIGVCIDRVESSDRLNKKELKDTIKDWYGRYTIADGEYATKARQVKFYNSHHWRGVNGLRQRALKRDNFECQECKRQGKVHVDSNKVHGERKTIELNVHHIKEIETHPELALTLSNLETLCLFHHNLIHEKVYVKKERFINEERW